MLKARCLFAPTAGIVVRAPAALAVAAFTLALSACGGSARAPGASKCLVDEPEPNTACSAETSECSYGTSVRVDCRAAYSCSAGRWQKHPGCVLGPVEMCPATPPSGNCPEFASDEPSKRICAYSNGTLCTCNSCSATGWCWECLPPPTQPGCPAIAPNLGRSCTNAGASGANDVDLTCTYGNPCQGGGSFTCKEGAWHPLEHSGCGE